jgi:hypothetical protein
MIVTACAPGARTFAVAFPPDGDIAEVPIVVTDETGLVTNVEETPAVERPVKDEFMRTIAGSPNSLIVQWLGSGCDGTVAIAVRTPGVSIRVASSRNPGVCNAVAIRRAVLIGFSRPVDVSRTSVEFAH